MSTKTMKKRVALVAASTLVAGFLSLVTVPTANAVGTSTVFSDDYTVSATPSVGNVGVCYVATQANTHTANTAATTEENALNITEMLSTGSLTLGEYGNAVAPMTAAGDETRFAISGPAYWDTFTANADGATPSLSADGKTFTFTFGEATSTDEPPSAIVLKPTGVGTIQVTISHYDHSQVLDSDGGVNVAKILTIKSVATCGSGSVSLSDSFVQIVPAASSGAAATTNITATDQGGTQPLDRAANGGSAYVRVDMYDSNDVALANGAATGTLTAEVSSGAFIGAAAVGTTNVAFSTDKSTFFQVTQATANTAWTGTITIKIDGVLVATRSAKIVGAPASIVVSGLDIRAQGAADAQGGDYVVLDAAGNETATAITGWVTFTDAQTKVITAGSSSRTPSQTAANTALGTTKGQFNYACKASGPGAVATGVALKYTNSALASITSPVFNITCGEAVYTYSASLDKASYVPGDIAKLTITGKGEYGSPVFDGETLGTAAAVPTIAGSQMTVVGAVSHADTFLAGVKTYTFTVGSTEGSYNMVVDLPEFNDVSTPQAAVTVPYKVAATTASVSNADVLKSIVALIASINKQIQALQKLILKR